MTAVDLSLADMENILSWGILHQDYYEPDFCNSLLDTEDSDQMTLTKVRAIIYTLREKNVRQNGLPSFLKGGND